ncbi:MAG: hypothetical protein JKX93_06255 [Rhizobiaceae bacterium]|nr:hypothetical protein [Rhizobiaceae bacterium]
MATAIRELERVLLASRLQHVAHPILRWHFDNIVVEIDKAGNKSFHKEKSTDRIDGAVACAMAVGRVYHGEGDTRSWWGLRIEAIRETVRTQSFIRPPNDDGSYLFLRFLSFKHSKSTFLRRPYSSTNGLNFAAPFNERQL